MNNDTIFALSSAPGKSGVAVIRISGNDLSKFFKRVVNKKKFESRHAYFTNLTDDNKDLIDQCIAIYFNAPCSFTGEDIIEIHSHGSPAVINKILNFYATKVVELQTAVNFRGAHFITIKWI